jgi:hypothetical protein
MTAVKEEAKVAEEVTRPWRDRRRRNEVTPEMEEEIEEGPKKRQQRPGWRTKKKKIKIDQLVFTL